MAYISLDQIPLDFGNDQPLDFELFLPGDNQALCDLLKKTSNGEMTHLIYLWGEKASGKTHLLQAACKQASEKDLRVTYIPLKEHKAISPEILHDLGSLDLVCIDDLDAIVGELEWQRAMVWLYNELRDSGHSLIISANVSALMIGLDISDLKSRLSWDQVLQIKAVDDDLKIKILKRIAEQRSFQLGDDVLQFLIRRVARDLDSLLKILDKIDQASLSAKRKITVPFIRELLEEASFKSGFL